MTDPKKATKAAPKRAPVSEKKAATFADVMASVPTAARLITKTPFYAAVHAQRYLRQELIKEIERLTGAKLLCYVAGDKRQIEQDDTIGFVELLHNIAPGQPIDLMLHTVGGDVDAAHKLTELIHARLGEGGRFRVIIPEAAKSAGTLMALGADEIVMSDSSELGMIDPQYILKDERGNEICTSVIAYLEAFKEYADRVERNVEDHVALAMLNQFDPVIIRKFQGYRDRSREIAMRLLNRKGANSTRISEALMDINRWKSHNQMIGHADARQLELNVIYLPPEDTLWQLFWHLHAMQRLEVGKSKKIFESAFVSQVFEA